MQELSKEKLSTVPPRYVRPDRDPLIPQNVSSLYQVPIIDMQKLSHNGSEELHNLHRACQEWGFFQLINHGVDKKVVETMKLQVQEFFNLPIEEKSKFNQESGDTEGYGQAFVVSEDQKLDWGDMFFVATSPSFMRKPHLIPKLPSSFKDAVEAYSSELKALSSTILRLIAKALEMRIEEMETIFKGEFQSMRMNYYPPCPEPELVTGLCPHSDASGLTILLQVSETEGLQIKKDGLWVPIYPIPEAFVVNIGDILEVVSNGAYKSIEHRAVVNKEKERLSIATFTSPGIDCEFGPAPSLVTLENPAKFKRIGAREYFKGLFSEELNGKSYLEAMRI